MKDSIGLSILIAFIASSAHAEILPVTKVEVMREEWCKGPKIVQDCVRFFVDNPQSEINKFFLLDNRPFEITADNEIRSVWQNIKMGRLTPDPSSPKLFTVQIEPALKLYIEAEKVREGCAYIRSTTFAGKSAYRETANSFLKEMAKRTGPASLRTLGFKKNASVQAPLPTGFT